MDDLLNLKEVAAILKIGRAAVQIWAKQGRIPAVKIGKSYRVRRRDLEAWFEAQRTTPTEPRVNRKPPPSLP